MGHEKGKKRRLRERQPKNNLNKTDEINSFCFKIKFSLKKKTRRRKHVLKTTSFLANKYFASGKNTSINFLYLFI